MPSSGHSSFHIQTTPALVQQSIHLAIYREPLTEWPWRSLEMAQQTATSHPHPSPAVIPWHSQQSHLSTNSHMCAQQPGREAVAFWYRQVSWSIITVDWLEEGKKKTPGRCSLQGGLGRYHPSSLMTTSLKGEDIYKKRWPQDAVTKRHNTTKYQQRDLQKSRGGPGDLVLIAALAHSSISAS